MIVMSVNKVKLSNGETVVDLTGDTVTAAKMLIGTTAHDKAGNKITGTIASQEAQTIIPTTTNKTIAAGKYLSGTQTINGDANLLPENIKSGVSIFGVDGTLETGGSGGGGDTLLVRNNTEHSCLCGAADVYPGEEVTISCPDEWSTRLVFGMMGLSECRIRYTGTFFSENEWDLVSIDFEEELYATCDETGIYWFYWIDTRDLYFRTGSIIEINPI